MALKNRRQEKFARELARGRTAVAAYAAAGYAGHRASASRLAGRAHIQARVDALEAAAMPRPEEVTLPKVIARLLEIADTAETDGAKGAALSVARASLMDVARLSGLLAGAKGGPKVKTLEDFLEELEFEEPGPAKLMSEAATAAEAASGKAKAAGDLEAARSLEAAAEAAAAASRLAEAAGDWALGPAEKAAAARRPAPWTAASAGGSRV
jgi:phage terminase small subunit